MILPDRMTLSLCPECYRKIPAQVVVAPYGTVEMVKKCPTHGRFTSIVERDATWWKYCQAHNSTNIYDGYMLDVTDRCNLKCAYCYHGSGEKDKVVEDIVADALKNKHLGPIVLTGGEPTIHPYLSEILRQLKGTEVVTLTNGVRLCDEAYLDELCEAGLQVGNILTIGLSFHKESGGKDMELLELCRKRGLKIGTSFYVIDDVAQMEEALTVYSEYRDVLQNIRIKAASNIWSEGKAANHIFVSDMLRYLFLRGDTEIMAECNNKVSFANVRHMGQHVMLVSWYDTANVDLLDINCGPYLKAMDGSVNNFVTSGLINEGMLRGEDGKAL